MKKALSLATLTFIATETNAVQLRHVIDDSDADACACLNSHGIPPIFNADGSSHILFGDFEYPWNFGTAFCAAWDEGLAPDCDGEDNPDFCT